MDQILTECPQVEVVQLQFNYVDYEAPSVESRRCYEVCRTKNLISCTACRYCTERCPRKIAIPALFACLNAKKQFNNWDTDYY